MLGITESPESGVNAVGSVGSSHDDDVSPLLQAVHQGQQLGHDAPLHLTMGLYTHAHDSGSGYSIPHANKCHTTILVWQVLQGALKKYNQHF